MIATGFEEKRKPKGLKTVKLDEDNFDAIADMEAEEDVNITSKDTSNVSQQTLLLDDEIDFEIPKEEDLDVVSDIPINDRAPSDNDAAKTITLDLNDASADYKEESAQEVISSIMLEEDPVSVKQIVDLDLDDEVLEDDSTLNTLETAQVNTEVMKIESREREERLRNISIKLRTPSGLTSLEDVPAYKRNNVEISEPTHSSESELSTYTLTNDNNTTELKQNNSFLHDNVD